MKQCFLWILLFNIAAAADAQFYFRGHIRDEAGKPLPFVRLQVHSNQSFYYSGADGGFGFPLKQQRDSVTLFLRGYSDTTVLMQAGVFADFSMRSNSFATAVHKQRIISFVKDVVHEPLQKESSGGETYSRMMENDFVNAEKYSSVGFAMNVDKASYSNIRRFINMQMRVPADAVRIEEMLNYFNQGYVRPPAGSTFFSEWQVTDCPWNSTNKLMFLRLHAQKVDYDSMPPNNLVFLIDISGSMELPNRLTLLKSAFRMLVENLRTKDTISVVVYGGSVGVRLYPTSGGEKEKIMKVIDSLDAAGDTPGEAALRMAYALAEKHFVKGGNNRIILATDGDFNVGEVSESALTQLVMSKQQTGVYLTCLGVGMGNYKDSRLELLAKHGNGNFAYLDQLKEAERVLVNELAQTLFTVADDAGVLVKFNPSYIKRYRLIGYDNMQTDKADSSNVLEGGDIGSGHIITAVFEFEPTVLFADAFDDLAMVEINFRVPLERQSKKEQFLCFNNYVSFAQLQPSYRFAAGVAMFGMLLRNSPYLNGSSWEMLNDIITHSADQSQPLQQQMQQLVQKAQLLYDPPKKRKRGRKD